MSEDRARFLRPFLFLLLIFCGVGFVGVANLYNMLETLRDYDPEAEAVTRLIGCIDAIGSKDLVRCGTVTDFCGMEIQEAVNREDNHYSVEVFYNNEKDFIGDENFIGIRGGHEIYMQVNFSHGEVFRVDSYEGSFASCEVIKE